MPYLYIILQSSALFTLGQILDSRLLEKSEYQACFVSDMIISQFAWII